MEESNDRLEEFLRDSFEGFEAEPSNNVWQKIEPNLPKTATSWYRSNLLLLLLLFLLIGGIGTWQMDIKLKSANLKSPNIKIEKTQLSQAKIKLNDAINSESRTLNATKLALQNPSKDPTLSSPRMKQMSSDFVLNQANKEQKIQKNGNHEQTVSESIDKLSTQKNIQKSEKIKEFSITNKANIENTNVFDNNKTPNGTLITPKIDDTKISENTNLEQANAIKLNTKSMESLPPNLDKNVEIIKQTEAQKSTYYTLNSKEINPFQIKIVLPIIPIFNYPQTTLKQNLPTSTFKYSFGVSIFNSYQNTQVVNRTELPIFQVVNPELFSQERQGQLVSLGIIRQIKNRAIRAEINYLKMQQWAYYDLATNIFNTEIDASNNIKYSQKIENYRENTINQYLSLSINEQFLFSKNQFLNYFVSVGGMYLVPLNATKINTGLTFSMGLQQQISKQFCFTIEPSINYFIDKVQDKNNLLKIEPYTVGLKINLIYDPKIK